MKNYIVRSEYDCLVKSSSGEELLDQNSQIVFDKPEKILIYPLKNSKNCFPFTIDFDGKHSSSLYRHFSLDDFDLFYISALPYIKKEIIETITTNNKTCKIYISEQEISFETDKIKKSFELQISFDTYSIDTSTNLILLKLSGKEEYLWVFNIETTDLRVLSGSKIEKINSEIFVSKTINSICKHDLYEVYELKDGNLIKNSEKLKSNFLENSIKNPNVIPYAFLEAVKLNDFDLARSYLTDSLSKSATNEHLKSYFKNIQKILPLKETLLGTISSEGFYVYTFVIKNGRIEEIGSKS